MTSLRRHSPRGLRAILIGMLCGLALPAFAKPKLETAPPPPISALFAPLHWRLVGPFRGGWGEMVEGVPSRPNTFYFTAAGGGVWRSDDAGRVWRGVFDGGPFAPVGAIAIAPSAPDTIYIGGGQPEPRYDVGAGGGVFKSTDGGKTWSNLGLAATRHIGRILIDPADADTVLVAAVGHFFGPNVERGVFRTTDGGKSWTRTLGVDADTGAVDLAADPRDAKTVFAATWQARQFPWQSYFTPVAGPGSGVYKSSDGGLTWTRLSGGGWPAGPLGRISVATTRAAAGLRVYAVVSAEKASGLYRSDDGGATWALVNDDPAFSSDYASRVTVAPDDPDVVYLVGQSIRRCDQGGKRCTIVKGAPGGDDYHFVWINPAHPDHMAVASDQGVVVSVDRGQTWSSWYNQPTGQFYHLAADDRFPYRLYSGQQDSGTVGILSRGPYGSISLRDWIPVGGDERDYDIPDPDDPNIVYSTGLGGRVGRWDAKTGQAANIAPYLLLNYGRRQISTQHHFVWVTPMAISKVGPTTLYLGGEVVFASVDHGDHWKIVSPDLTGKAEKAERCGGDVALADARACGYGGIWSLATSPRHAGELWIGTDSGLVQLTRDGGEHWTNITPPGLPAWAKIASIDPSGLTDGLAYIAVDNHRQDDFKPRLMVTRDYGAHWRDATGDLPADHYASVVRADPVRPGLLFAGTEVGVWVSFDDGAHWQSLRRDLPTAQVNDLLIHGDDLAAATQGRALWILGDLALLRQADSTTTADRAHLFAPADAVRVHANVNRDTPAPIEEPAGENPPAGATIDYWLASPAKQVAIEVRDDAGALVARLTSDATPKPRANAYFAAEWLHPAGPLATEAGAHRALWNLRYNRPLAIGYDYSMETAAGGDTPITPDGPMAAPGTYQITLIVDGVKTSQRLRLAPDPRETISPADLAASITLSRRIGEALALARRGEGERESAFQQLSSALARLGAAPNQAALVSQLRDVIARCETPKDGATFTSQSALLAEIESDLESADQRPTAAQQETADAAIAQIERHWRDWSAVRDQAIAALATPLRRAGLVPVVIPPEDRLTVTTSDDDADLP